MLIAFKEWFPELIGILQGKRMNCGRNPSTEQVYTESFVYIVTTARAVSPYTITPFDRLLWLNHILENHIQHQVPTYINLLSSENDCFFFCQDWVLFKYLYLFQRERKRACLWSWIDGFFSSPNSTFFKKTFLSFFLF